MPEVEATEEVVKWHTRARKFPQVIGRTPEGKKIWGGPYTLTQAVGGFVTFLFLLYTREIWGRIVDNNIFMLVVILLAATAFVTLLLGRLPPGTRNPLTAAMSVARLVLNTSVDHSSNRSLKQRKPYLVPAFATPGSAVMSQRWSAPALRAHNPTDGLSAMATAGSPTAGPIVSSTAQPAMANGYHGEGGYSAVPQEFHPGHENGSFALDHRGTAEPYPQPPTALESERHVHSYPAASADPEHSPHFGDAHPQPAEPNQNYLQQPQQQWHHTQPPSENGADAGNGHVPSDPGMMTGLQRALRRRTNGGNHA